MEIITQNSFTVGDKVRMHYDPVTGEHGMQIKVQVGEAVVKGSPLAVSAAANNKYIKQTSGYDVVCIAYEAGSTDGYIWGLGYRCSL